MSDLNAKVIADLKRELAEAKSEANAVTESMGSEIMRLHGEIEQQRTRADAAEQELRDYTAHVAQSKNEDRSKLAAISAHLPALKRLHAWVSSERMGEWTYLEGGTFYGDVQEMAAVVADALEALEP